MNKFIISVILVSFFLKMGFCQTTYFGYKDFDMPDEIIHFKIDTLGLTNIVAVDNNGFDKLPNGSLNVKCFNKINALVKISELPTTIKFNKRLFTISKFKFPEYSLELKIVNESSEIDYSYILPVNLVDLNPPDQKILKEILESSQKKYTVVGNLWYNSSKEELDHFFEIAKYSNEMDVELVINTSDKILKQKIIDNLKDIDITFCDFSKELEKDLNMNYWPNFNLFENSSGNILSQDRLEKVFEHLRKINN